MEIWTAQISSWRRIRAFGIEIVDITAKSGFHWFAPEYENVMLYKNGQMSQEQYTELYLQKMRWSFRQYHANWALLKHKPDVAFVCFCRPDTFCHRHIFVGLLAKYFDKEGVPYTLKGELY